METLKNDLNDLKNLMVSIQTELTDFKSSTTATLNTFQNLTNDRLKSVEFKISETAKKTEFEKLKQDFSKAEIKSSQMMVDDIAKFKQEVSGNVKQFELKIDPLVSRFNLFQEDIGSKIYKIESKADPTSYLTSAYDEFKTEIYNKVENLVTLPQLDAKIGSLDIKFCPLLPLNKKFEDFKIETTSNMNIAKENTQKIYCHKHVFPFPGLLVSTFSLSFFEAPKAMIASLL